MSSGHHLITIIFQSVTSLAASIIFYIMLFSCHRWFSHSLFFLFEIVRITALLLSFLVTYACGSRHSYFISHFQLYTLSESRTSSSRIRSQCWENMYPHLLLFSKSGRLFLNLEQASDKIYQIETASFPQVPQNLEAFLRQRQTRHDGLGEI